MVSSDELRRRIKHQHELNHHIPDIVIDFARSLKSMRCKDLLENFASSYYDTNFETLQDEFRFVKNHENELVKFCSDESLSEELQRMMDTDLAGVGAAKILQHSFRDHFVHSFQDFLTGVIVMDKYYDSFVHWYSENLNSDIRSGIECAWLMTTVLHDRYKPLLEIGDMVKEKLLHPFEENRLTAKRLSSIYRHLCNGGPLENWSSEGSDEDPLIEILLKHARRDNHAVRAGFALPTYGLQIGDPTLYASALAIALHDGKTRDDLISAEIFPIKMENFPLLTLLSYIDAVQEWDRSSSSETVLIDMRFDGNEVLFEVQFDTTSAALGKAKELEGVSACLASPSPIRLAFSSKVFVA